MDSSSALQFLLKAAPVDPVTATVLKTFYEIFELQSKIQAVDEQTRDLLSTTHHVAFNVKEARRMYRVKASILDFSENVWIEGVIKDTEEALLAVAQLIEPARVNRAVKQKIDFANKVEWVFKQNAQVAGKQARLNNCCHFLTAVIACLHSKSAAAPAPLLEEQHSPHNFSMERFLIWESQRKRRKSVMSLNSEQQQRSPGLSRCSNSFITDVTSSESSASTKFTDPRSSTLSLPAGFEDSARGPMVKPSPSYGQSPLRTRPASEPFTPIPRPKFSSFMSVHSWPEVDEEPTLASPDRNDYFPNPRSTTDIPVMAYKPMLSADTPSADNGPPAPFTSLEACYDGADGLQVYNPYMPYTDSPTADERPRSTITSPAEIDSPSMIPYPDSDPPRSLNPTFQNMPDPLTYRRHTSESAAPARSGFYGLRQSLGNLRTWSDSYQQGIYQDGITDTRFDRLASPAVEERRSCGANNGRGRRSWLAYHASRKDLRSGGGWGRDLR